MKCFKMLCNLKKLSMCAFVRRRAPFSTVGNATREVCRWRACTHLRYAVLTAVHCVCIYVCRREKGRDNRWERWGQKDERRTETQRGRVAENKQREQTSFMRFAHSLLIMSPFLPCFITRPVTLSLSVSSPTTHTRTGCETSGVCLV